MEKIPDGEWFPWWVASVIFVAALFAILAWTSRPR